MHTSTSSNKISYFGDMKWPAPCFRTFFILPPLPCSSESVTWTLIGGRANDTGPPLTVAVSNPVDCAISAGGDVYWTDSCNVRMLNVATNLVSRVVGTGCGEFATDGGVSVAHMSNVSGIALGTDGELWFVQQGLVVKRLVGMLHFNSNRFVCLPVICCVQTG
jgi:hypothetical protein